MLKSNSAKVKNQLYLLIGSFILSFFPVLSLSLIPYVFFNAGQRVPFYYSIISVVIFPITLTYMLTQHEIIDVMLKLKQVVSKLIAIVLTLAFANLLYFLFFQDYLKYFYRANLMYLAIIICAYLLGGFYSVRSYRRFFDKTQVIEKEKLQIMQHISNGKHLRFCARLIIQLIEQTVDVKGAALVWKQKGLPRILHQTGIFVYEQPALNLLVKMADMSPERIQKQYNILILPLSDSASVKGWIFLGQKTNGTRFAKSEYTLIHEICSDALSLLDSSEFRAKLDEELEKTQNQSYSEEQFNALLMNSIDESRRNLSLFLHDDILQNVILLENRIDNLHRAGKIDDAAYQEIHESFLNTIYEIREKSRELHPFVVEDLGLEQSIQVLKKNLQTNYNIIVDASCDLGMTVIPKKVELAVFRIIKELLHNSIKHASVPVVKVSLKCANRYLYLTASDQGRGFDLAHTLRASTGHIGLLTVQKTIDLLHGICDIQSSPGCGTTITITMPLEWNDDRDNQYHPG
ncbi:ATP-binding protein [Sporolactobacillus sp. CPB3-1]|uniref:histidine kinase n=1 Tax=Sporolactobacillus mangiferae TaxID=2940498 RepID=A0ABT0MB53_9BACL|nr:ATP-binding protein [Sporolactobacillus mangiferae]MCL1632082.1 ATP-binding protein [Sporolactobacillus mangiferae]